MSQPAYKRILLKLSGEALMGDDAYGINQDVVTGIVTDVAEVVQLGVEVGIVIGGGNIFRGMAGAASGMDRATADYMGMLATIINAMALQDACEKLDLITRVQSAIEMKSIAEAYIRRKAMRHLEKNRIVIFAGGTGNPYFTTDTTAALRAVEVGCQVILKATKVDGVYDADPKKVKDAKRFTKISFMESIQRRLKVMDSTALALCMENNLPIIVFDIFKEDNLKNLVQGDKVGTLISSSDGVEYA